MAVIGRGLTVNATNSALVTLGVSLRDLAFAEAHDFKQQSLLKEAIDKYSLILQVNPKDLSALAER